MRLNAAFYELNAMKNVSLMQMKLIQVRDSRRKTFLFATDIIKWCFEADKCLQSMFLFYYFGWMKTPIVFLWSKINDRDHLLTNNAGLTLKTSIFDKCRRHYTIFFDIINFFFLIFQSKIDIDLPYDSSPIFSEFGLQVSHLLFDKRSGG